MLRILKNLLGGNNETMRISEYFSCHEKIKEYFGKKTEHKGWGKKNVKQLLLK